MVMRRNLRDAHERATRAEAVARGDLAVAEERSSRLTAALDAIGDSVIVVDAAGTELARNVAASRFRAARHSNAAVAELIDRLVARALEGEDCEQELPLFGPPREVLVVRARPLHVDGASAGAVVVVRDVTEQRRTDDVRRDFVANVSHELKTPIGALALLAETIASTDEPDTARALTDQMLRETDRLARIVDDLLDLSLIEIQEAPSRDPVPAAVLVQEAIDRMEPAAAAAGIGLHVEDRTAGASLHCDKRQVVSALTNLLDNAVKYSERGSGIEVSSAVDGDRLVLSVRDAGIGIPRGDLERIFERFYRVDHARSRDTGGTGLGLAIVRHVAGNHDGDVSVESSEGEGSTFTLRLPVRAGPVAVTAEAG
jgi:two-component system sensor histidine kinase SenX3